MCEFHSFPKKVSPRRDVVGILLVHFWGQQYSFTGLNKLMMRFKTMRCEHKIKGILRRREGGKLYKFP